MIAVRILAICLLSGLLASPAMGFSWRWLEPQTGRSVSIHDSAVAAWQIDEEPVFLELPANKALLFLGESNNQGQIRVWESRGDGLQQPAELRSLQGQKYLLGATSAKRQLWLEAGDAAQGQPQAYRLLIMESQEPEFVEPFALSQQSVGRTVNLTEDNGRSSDWLHSAELADGVDVEGPQRLQLDYRLILPEQSNALPRLLSFSWRLADQPLAERLIDMDRLRVRSLKMDACVRRIGEPLTVEILIPAGRHRLHLNTQAAALVRLRKAGPRLLLPGINHAVDAALQRYREQSQARNSAAAHRMPWRQQLLDGLPQLPNPALWEASDSFWRNLAITRADAKPVTQLHTPLRLPSLGDTEEPVFTDTEAMARPRHYPSYRLSEIAPGAPLTVSLPERHQATGLQLVLAGLPDEPGDFRVSYDNGPSWQLRWRPELKNPELLAADLRARGLAAAPFASGSGHFLSGASATLPLPAAVREVRIEALGGVARGWVGAAYRAERAIPMDETLVRPALQALGRHAALERIASAAPGAQSKASRHLEPLLDELAVFIQRRAGTVVAALDSRGAALSGRMFDRISRLEEQGDSRRAERLLTGMAIYAADAGQRQRARAQLLADYLPVDEQLRWQGVFAATWLQHGDPQMLGELASSLLKTGEVRLAWLLALLLEATENDETLATASLLSDNPVTFAEALTRLAPQRQAYWRGHQAIRRGDSALAIKYWLSAGPAGAHMTSGLREAQSIAESLPRGLSGAHIQRWADWEADQAREDYVWQAADDSVWQSAGPTLALGYQGSPNVSLQEAAPGAPARVWLSGPTRVRVTLRPLHGPGTENTPMDDWIEFKAGAKAWQLPILGNLALGSLRRIDGKGTYGGAQTFEFQVAEGMAELAITPRQLTHGVTVEVARPLVELPVLPALTATHRLAVAQGTPRRLQGSRPTACRISASNTQLYELTQPELRLPPGQAARVTPPLGALLVSGGQPHALSGDALSAAHKLLWQIDQAESSLAKAQRRAQLLALLANVQAQSPEQKRWVQRIESHVKRELRWREIEHVSRSAGLNVRSLAAERSPSIERRMQASPSVLTAGQTLLSASNVGVRLELGKTAQVRALIKVHPEFFSVPAPVQLWATLSQQAPQGHRLAPDVDVHTINWQLEPGTHSVRIRLEQRWIDHLVSVEWQWQVDGRWESLQSTRESTVLISQRNDPVGLYLEQDQWLRVDVWLKDRIESRYLLAKGPGWWYLPHDDKERLEVRLYQLEPASQAVAAAQSRRPELPLPEPERVAAPASEWPGVIPERISLRPDHQAGGTWSVGEGYRYERDGSGNDYRDDQGRERLLQYRLHPDQWPVYLRTDLSIREHAYAPDSSGVRQWLDLEWPNSAWSASFQGSAFQQRQAETSKTLTSWKLSGELAYQTQLSDYTEQRSWARLYTWNLNDKRSDFSRVKGIDPDIWTPWLDSHPNGLQLGSSYRYQPWLDGEAMAELRAWSHEDIAGLDSVEPSLVWRQFLDGTTASARVSVRHSLAGGPRKDSLTMPRIELGLDGRRSFGRPGSLAWHLDFDVGLKGGNTGVNLEFVWHWDGRRGMKDVRPQEWAFRRLHEIELLEDSRNNNVALP